MKRPGSSLLTMVNNYFTLCRIVPELRKRFTGQVCSEAFSYRKDTLALVFDSGDKDDAGIECSVSPGIQHITAYSEITKKKKNVVNFFEALLPAELKAIDIAEYDRVIRFTFDKFLLYFTIRGKQSNVITLDSNDTIETFKQEEEADIKELVRYFRELQYTSSFLLPSLPEAEGENAVAELRKDRPYISREIAKELQIRIARFPEEKPVSLLQKILLEIQREPYALFVSGFPKTVSIAPVTFAQPPDAVIERKETVTAAVAAYIRMKSSLKNFEEDFKRIEKYLDKELSYFASKINKLRGRVEKGSREEEYSNMANLLLSNLYRMKRGMKSITLENFYDEGNEIAIPLKEDKSPNENAEIYFKKARGEKINYRKSLELLDAAKERYEKLKQYLSELKAAEKREELKELIKELKIPVQKMQDGKEESRFNFKEYIIEGKFHVWVGRDSANNDVLTLKFAKQNDYWFHARAVPGSHVVLRGDNPKEPVPKNILKKAASLAAYHSKAKTAGTVPVSYTFKKYVIKKKGMPPGKVALMKEDVLLVRPGIPDGCEFVRDEE